MGVTASTSVLISAQLYTRVHTQSQLIASSRMFQKYVCIFCVWLVHASNVLLRNFWTVFLGNRPMPDHVQMLLCDSLTSIEPSSICLPFLYINLSEISTSITFSRASVEILHVIFLHFSSCKFWKSFVSCVYFFLSYLFASVIILLFCVMLFSTVTFSTMSK